jgi:hypothetical protein
MKEKPKGNRSSKCCYKKAGFDLCESKTDMPADEAESSSSQQPIS